jgi:hypothetical protein
MSRRRTPCTPRPLPRAAAQSDHTGAIVSAICIWDATALERTASARLKKENLPKVETTSASSILDDTPLALHMADKGRLEKLYHQLIPMKFLSAK